MDFDPRLFTWSCMVCGEERPDEQISVAHRPLDPLLQSRHVQGPWNVRYCNDRLGCISYANADGPWMGAGMTNEIRRSLRSARLREARSDVAAGYHLHLSTTPGTIYLQVAPGELDERWANEQLTQCMDVLLRQGFRVDRQPTDSSDRLEVTIESPNR